MPETRLLRSSDMQSPVAVRGSALLATDSPKDEIRPIARQ
jgi:hypothetical protein